MSEIKLYKTADITLAATLIEKGLKLAGLEPITEKKKHDICRFTFEDTPERAQLILSYTSKALFVEPTAFMNNIRNLKQLIKEKKKHFEDD